MISTRRRTWRRVPHRITRSHRRRRLWPCVSDFFLFVLILLSSRRLYFVYIHIRYIRNKLSQPDSIESFARVNVTQCEALGRVDRMHWLDRAGWIIQYEPYASSKSDDSYESNIQYMRSNGMKSFLYTYLIYIYISDTYVYIYIYKNGNRCI